MSTILTLTKSSAKMFWRNRQALFFTLFTPLIIMTVFGLIGFDRPAKIKLGVVSPSPNPATASFLQQLEKMPVLEVSRGTAEEEAKALDQGERVVVLAVPDNFIPQDPTDRGLRTATAFVNAGEKIQAENALGLIGQFLDKANLSQAGANSVLQLTTQEINSQNLTYIDFLVPGIVALAVMQMAVFSVAFVFADYKEKGILKRLLATPVRPYQFVAANVLTRLVIAVLQAAILIAVGVLAFQAAVVGSYWLILLVVMLGAIMFLGLGFTISGLANTVETVPALTNLVVFPMLFLGGTFFPIDSMPNWLQAAAGFLPLTHFSEALRAVMTRGAGIWEIREQLAWMLLWSALLVGLANFVFGFEEKRQ